MSSAGKPSQRIIVPLLAVAVLLAIPATALATHLFADVVDGGTHSAGIQFMKDSGVSAGCGDGTNYCPFDPVTREQMGTFMYRLSGTDPKTPPSVNAADAELLGGKTPEEYTVRAGHGDAIPAIVPDAITTLVASVQITAPADGGALHITGGASFAIDLNLAFGFLVLDVNGDGICTAPTGIGSAQFWDTLVLLDSAQTSSTVGVNSGTHTVDLCAFGLNTLAGEATTLSAAGLDVLWVPAGPMGGAFPLSAQAASPEFLDLRAVLEQMLTKLRADM